MDTEMPERQAQNAHAVVAFTGDYISFTSNSKGIMIRNGIVYYDRDEIGSMAILPNGTLRYYKPKETRAAELLAQGVKDTFSFLPLLINDGKCVLNNPWGEGEHTMRVAFGYTDPYHYITLVSLRDREYQLTFQKCADILLRYGAKFAYNLDGGHSTSLVFMGKELSLLTLTGVDHHNIRALSDIVVFLENDTVQPPAEDPPAEEQPAEDQPAEEQTP